MNIEISYMVIYAAIIITLILTVTRKMSMGIGLTGIGTGFAIAYFLGPYMQIVMGPLGQAIFYGGDWSLQAILGAMHLGSMVVILLVAIYNLMSSGGKIVWA